jgi:predicted nucleic acid-binding Zn ribbon protein
VPENDPPAAEPPFGAAPAAAGDPADEGDDAARGALERARAAAVAKGLRRSAPGSTRRGTRPGPGLGDALSGAGPSRRDPQPVGGLVEKLLVDRGWEQPVSVGGVVGRWRAIVGDDVADHCSVETFDEARLVLRADSTAWATQLRLLLPQLERRLAEEVGEGTVESITVLGPGGTSWRRGNRSVPGRGPRDTYG